MYEESKFWMYLEKGWGFIESAFIFLDNKKTKIGVALSLIASYWLGVDQIVSTSDGWRDLIPSLLAFTSSYIAGGAAIHNKYKEIQTRTGVANLSK
jgi:hypothetical protein